MKDGSIVLTAFTRAGAELALKLADLLKASLQMEHPPLSPLTGGTSLASSVRGSGSSKAELMQGEMSNGQKAEVRVFVSGKNFVEGTELMTGSLSDWAGEYFNKSQAMIFVCACGIAVRAIAPYIKSKLEDPAVIVIDEKGQFVIPVLSGHVGGANDLARKIANFTHGTAFVTTATDVNNLVAVDEWAVKNDLIIENPKLIKEVSGAVLNHERVGVAITEQNVKTPWPATLFLRPKNLVLGAGCKKDFEPEKFEQAALKFLEDAGVSPLSLKAVASINIKANEAALINFAAKYNLEFLTFKAEELMSVQGDFASSQKVLEVTGADNVCERAAALAALRLGNSQNYILMRSKTKFQGVTCALAKIYFDAEQD